MQHATLPTIIIQTGAGALVGAAFVTTVMYYVLRRRVPASRAASAQAPASAATTHPGAAPAAPSVIRRAVVLLFGVGLLAIGGMVLLACLAHPSIYGLVRGAFGAVFLMALGGYLVWDDVLAPLIRTGTRDKSPLG